MHYLDCHLARLDEQIRRRRFHKDAARAVVDTLRVRARSENPHSEDKTMRDNWSLRDPGQSQPESPHAAARTPPRRGKHVNTHGYNNNDLPKTTFSHEVLVISCSLCEHSMSQASCFWVHFAVVAPRLHRQEKSLG